jgi:hypothetical protein
MPLGWSRYVIRRFAGAHKTENPIDPGFGDFDLYA